MTWKILITGAAGMLGCKLAAALARQGHLAEREIEQLTLSDVSLPENATSSAAGAIAGDLAEPGVAASLIQRRPDLIFHLAAVVSGEAEADFAKGYRVNVDATRALFEAIREAQEAEEGYRPRLVLSSSVACFGPPLPEEIDDEHHLTPATSYGTQKAIGELLLADYTRRGFLDGVGIRLPTLVIRPGKPNKAASGFFSNILREPLIGEEAVLPVSETLRHWFASPRAAVHFLLQAAVLDGAALGAIRTLNMPGLSATVAEEIEALRRVAGERAVRLIRREPDPAIAKIVAGWPRSFDARRALALGFRAESCFDEIIQAHVEDELGA